MSIEMGFATAIVLGVWLLILTVVLFLQIRFFRKLTKGTKEHELVKILNKILETQDKNSDELASIKKEVARLDDEGFLHIQKVGFIRFNPFKEIGGDHSFSLAVLDGKDTGFVITGLHTRERTRIYAKEIKKGKSEVELSSEEKNALEKANKR